ncbi:DUF4145 domain-containing protein [Candidatus Gracilibacteria bacterium]|nr:DUF4145 domain-containing protein [Candidatus Gracilibacteria bacterium]NUJ98798.1 DUF4145 domain-containing protein [Candidatus Gracilibacteria bacterium]
MVQKNIFIDKYKEIPYFACPHCNTGRLEFLKSDIIEKESGLNQNLRDNSSWEFDEFLMKFILIANCQNRDCGENAVISGEKFPERNYKPSFDSEDGEERFKNGINYINENYYKIKYIFPAPFIITIPIEIYDLYKDRACGPKCEIVENLIKSFELFWIDEHSCANKMRIIIELIMDYEGIPKESKNKKGENYRLSLGDRINRYKENNEEQSERLLAIKWIGNDGSHSSCKLHKEELLEVYEILESILEKVFSKKEERINKKVSEINKNKGIS